MRIEYELPPSYHECIRKFEAKSQTMFDVKKLAKFDSIKTSIDNDRLNNNIIDENVSFVQVNDATTSDANGNIISSDDNTLEMINGKGVIKLDMSRIIDPTGLPTYEAALKLKSSSYI